MTEATKYCFKCGKMKPMYMFYNHRGTPDGHQMCCIKCQTGKEGMAAGTNILRRDGSPSGLLWVRKITSPKGVFQQVLVECKCGKHFKAYLANIKKGSVKRCPDCNKKKTKPKGGNEYVFSHNSDGTASVKGCSYISDDHKFKSMAAAKMVVTKGAAKTPKKEKKVNPPAPRGEIHQGEHKQAQRHMLLAVIKDMCSKISGDVVGFSLPSSNFIFELLIAQQLGKTMRWVCAEKDNDAYVQGIDVLRGHPEILCQHNKGLAGEVLGRQDDGEFHFVWLDYCGFLTSHTLEDCQIAIQKMRPNGVLAVTVLASREQEETQQLVKEEHRKVLNRFGLSGGVELKNGRLNAFQSLLTKATGKSVFAVIKYTGPNGSPMHTYLMSNSPDPSVCCVLEV